VTAATTQNGTAGTRAADPGTSSLLRWVVGVHGVLAIVFGALLVLIPGRTLTFVAALIGAYLIVLGLVYAATALLTHGLVRQQRLAGSLMGALAVVAGAVVIARPEGSIRTVAVVAGIYLIVVGAASVFLRLGAVRGLLALAAGIALVAWPDVTVGVVATLAGIFMLLRGAVELIAALRAPSRP
jgi:uncharacterized membrane protein HdeD (DUF308 family)